MKIYKRVSYKREGQDKFQEQETRAIQSHHQARIFYDLKDELVEDLENSNLQPQ